MEKLKSRKLWMAIITAFLVIANNGLDMNLPTNSILSIVGVAIAYILGQSHVDAMKLPLFSLSSLDTQVEPMLAKQDEPQPSSPEPKTSEEPAEPAPPTPDPNQEKVNQMAALQEQIATLNQQYEQIKASM